MLKSSSASRAGAVPDAWLRRSNGAFLGKDFENVLTSNSVPGHRATEEPPPEVNDQLTVGPRDARRRCVVEYRNGVVLHRDVFDPDSARRRTQFIRGVAKKHGCDPDELARLDDHIIAQTQHAETPSPATSGQSVGGDASVPEVSPQSQTTETDSNVQEAAEKFLGSPCLFDELASDFAELGIVGEKQLATLLYVLGTSRLANTPLHGIIQSPSSSGKSFVAEQVIGLMPPAEVLSATAISPNALYNLGEDGLKHKVVFLAERQHAQVRPGSPAANGTLALRELLSKGEITKKVTVGGKTRSIHQKGPIAYLETTTLGKIFAEDASRMLSLSTDASREQTRRIMRETAERAAGNGPDEARLAFIRQKHHAAQRMLEPLKVRIPYAELLSLPSTNPTARRAFDHLLACIKAVALLCQKDRPVIDGAIDATPADYGIVYELLVPVLRRSLSPECQSQFELAKLLETESKGQPFTMADMKEWTHKRRTTLNDLLKPLRGSGLIEEVKTGNRRKKTYRVASSVTATSIGVEGLITPADLEKQVGDAGSLPTPTNATLDGSNASESRQVDVSDCQISA